MKKHNDIIYFDKAAYEAEMHAIKAHLSSVSHVLSVLKANNIEFVYIPLSSEEVAYLSNLHAVKGMEQVKGLPESITSTFYDKLYSDAHSVYIEIVKSVRKDYYTNHIESFIVLDNKIVFPESAEEAVKEAHTYRIETDKQLQYANLIEKLVPLVEEFKSLELSIDNIPTTTDNQLLGRFNVGVWNKLKE